MALEQFDETNPLIEILSYFAIIKSLTLKNVNMGGIASIMLQYPIITELRMFDIKDIYEPTLIKRSIMTMNNNLTFLSFRSANTDRELYVLQIYVLTNLRRFENLKHLEISTIFTETFIYPLLKQLQRNKPKKLRNLVVHEMGNHLINSLSKELTWKIFNHSRIPDIIIKQTAETISTFKSYKQPNKLIIIPATRQYLQST